MGLKGEKQGAGRKEREKEGEGREWREGGYGEGVWGREEYSSFQDPESEKHHDFQYKLHSDLVLLGQNVQSNQKPDI